MGCANPFYVHVRACGQVGSVAICLCGLVHACIVCVHADGVACVHVRAGGAYKHATLYGIYN